MNLYEHYFNIIVQSAGTIYWTIAVLLIFLKVPLTEAYLPYRKSKYFLAATYFIMGVNIFIWLGFFSGNWVHRNPYVMCLDVCLFYLAAIFFGCSFCNLLDSHYLTPRRIVKDLFLWLGTSLLLIVSQVEGLPVWGRWTFIILSLLLFLEVIVKYIYRFHKLYAHKKQLLDDYFPEDMQRFMSWLKKSLYFTLLYAVFAMLTVYLGIGFNFAFQAYAIIGNLYIAISFVNYAAQYGRIVLAEEKPAEEKATEDDGLDRNDEMDNYEQLFGKRLEQWVDEKKYLVPQFTIDELAGDLGTNKLYMSRYINQKYNANFSSWVTSLRIEEAKKFMLMHPNIKQEEVALHSGFSSSSYFSKVFSRVEGMTPVRWRKEQEGSE